MFGNIYVVCLSVTTPVFLCFPEQQTVNKTTRKVFKSCGVNVSFDGKVNKLLNSNC